MNLAVSFAAVVMLAEPGKARFAECVSVRIPANIRVICRPSQLFVLAIAVIVVVPVILKLEPVLGGVIELADAMFEPSVTSCLMNA